MLLWAEWMCQHHNTFHHIPVTNIWGNSGVIFTSLSQRGVIASIASPSWGFSKLLGPTGHDCIPLSQAAQKVSFASMCSARQAERGTGRNEAERDFSNFVGQICQMQEDFCAYCSVNISKPVIFPVNISKPVFFHMGKKKET